MFGTHGSVPVRSRARRSVHIRGHRLDSVGLLRARVLASGQCPPFWRTQVPDFPRLPVSHGSLTTSSSEQAMVAASVLFVSCLASPWPVAELQSVRRFTQNSRHIMSTKTIASCFLPICSCSWHRSGRLGSPPLNLPCTQPCLPSAFGSVHMLRRARQGVCHATSCSMAEA